MATPFELVQDDELPFVRLQAAPEQVQHDKLAAISRLGDLALRRVIILGIPGAGKTTLVETLQELNPAFNYISLGAISRDLAKNSPERRALDELFAAGRPIGDPALFLDILSPHIDAALDRNGGFVLDGMPKKASEIRPLLDFLADKQADPEAIISCEVSPMIAHQRTLTRASRPGDPDTMNIFLNRTKTYLRDLDTFKEHLTANGERPIITLNTETTSARAAANIINLLGQPIERPNTPASMEETSRNLYKAIAEGDRTGSINIYGQLFDDILPEINHGAVCSSDFEPYRQAYIETALTIKDPTLSETPRFLERLAKNYADTTLMSINHLLESAEEEVVLRYGEDYTPVHLAEILGQQLGLKQLIDMLQQRLVQGTDLDTHIDTEIVANLPELAHIELVLKKRAEALGLDPEAISAHELMRVQPRLWGQLTSNQTLASPDFNYRRASNGVPGAHHSLLPFTRNTRAMNANSMGDYIPFVEAVSATENEFSSTFGFIHFVGLDKNGESYGIEYPIMMHDNRLLAFNSPTINYVLHCADSFYSNHDLWHNLLPVYSKSFILHHVDAPLSYGGRLPNYIEFGNGLREEKEEYEIGVAMAHASTQQERFVADPEIEDSQAKLILSALERLKQLPDEISAECSSEEAQVITDYLASMLATKAYNVFPDNHPIYRRIEPLLQDLGVRPLTVQSTEVADLLYMQGLLDSNRLAGYLNVPAEAANATTIREALQTNSELATFAIRNFITTTQSTRESGAEYIVEALARWGVLDQFEIQSEATLGVLEKSRWLAMVAPQRQQLKGHMEKVHGKSGYIFNGALVNDPRDLVLMQKSVLDQDDSEYIYRRHARSENQQLAYTIYSLLFDDNQDVARVARHELKLLRSSKDTGQKLFAREAVGMLDSLLNELVKNTYAPSEEHLAYLESYAMSLPTSSPLHLSLHEIIKRYRILTARELAHQQERGISYASTAKILADEHMDIA